MCGGAEIIILTFACEKAWYSLFFFILLVVFYKVFDKNKYRYYYLIDNYFFPFLFEASAQSNGG